MIKKQDAERIIKERQGRLDELSRPEVWDRYTRHLECGELKEFKQSCIDDEIIIEALKPYATEKPLTNFDRIKAMSVEEMANWISNIHNVTITRFSLFEMPPSVEEIKKMLESEVQGE